MSDTSQGDGWWMASDGKWYAPELHPDYVAPARPEPPAPEPPAPEPPAAEAAPPLAPEPTEAVPSAAPPFAEPTVAQPASAPPPTEVIAPVPVDAAPPVPPIAAPPVGPDGPPPGGDRPFYRKPVVILVVVLAVLAGAVAAYALTGGGDGNKVSTKSVASDLSTGSASTDSTASKSTPTKKKTSTSTSTSTSPAATSETKLTIVAGGSSVVDASGTRYALAGATVTNPDANLAAYDVKVVFNLLDSGGTVLDTDTVAIDYIGPGKTVFAAPASIGFAASADVAKVDAKGTADFRKDDGYGGVELGVYKGIDIKVADAAITPDEHSSRIVGHLTNPSSTSVDYSSVTCVLYAGSTIVGGTSNSVGDTIGAGGTIEFDAYIDFVPAGADGVQCQAIA